MSWRRRRSADASGPNSTGLATEREGWGLSRDPDARADTLVMYVNLDRLVGLIHESLAQGTAVVAGTDDHSFLIYGADYDGDGKPLSYLIKDSLAPFLYRESADELHGKLNDVTVATAVGASAPTRRSSPPAESAPRYPSAF